MYRQANVKTVCADVTFLAMLDLLEVELEDEEEKERKERLAPQQALLELPMAHPGEVVREIFYLIRPHSVFFSLSLWILPKASSMTHPKFSAKNGFGLLTIPHMRVIGPAFRPLHVCKPEALKHEMNQQHWI